MTDTVRRFGLERRGIGTVDHVSIVGMDGIQKAFVRWTKLGLVQAEKSVNFICCCDSDTKDVLLESETHVYPRNITEQIDKNQYNMCNSPDQ